MPEEDATVEAWVSVSAAPMVVLILARYWGRRRGRRSGRGCGCAVVRTRREWQRMRCMNGIDCVGYRVCEYWVLVW